MARTNLSVQNVVRAGLTPTETAADVANGNQFDNDTENRTFLKVRNSGGSPYNVTITPLDPADADGLNVTIADRVVAVTNGATVFIGPFPSSVYTQPDGKIYASGANAALLFSPVKLPNA